jgi:high-affinity iron transporter
MRGCSAWTGLVGASLALASASVARGQSQENPGAQSLYLRYCAECHGETGHGDGPAAASLQPPPADLTRSAMSRSEVIRVIDGRRPVRRHQSGTAMPAWSSIFESEPGAGPRTSRIRVDALADHVLQLRKAAR